MLRFEETRITQLLKETIKVICRSADNCSEIAVQGLLGITLDRREIFLVQIDDVIDKALERTGNPFHAAENTGTSDPNSTQGLPNQAAEQLQPKPDLNLTAGSVDGRTLNNSTVPENLVTQQAGNSISVADSVNHSLLQTQTRRVGKSKTESSVSFPCRSSVQSPQGCSTATVSTPVVRTPVTAATKTAFACVSKRGRGRGRGQHGRGRGHCGSGRGKLAVTSSYQSKGSSVAVTDGLSRVPHPDKIKTRTRSSFLSETRRTASSSQEAVEGDSQSLENLEGGNESQTVGDIQSAEHKTLKTLKQPGFKRKLKPHGVRTSKKSKRDNHCSDLGADSGVVSIKPEVSSGAQSLKGSGICKRTFSKPKDLAAHYTVEHPNNNSTGHAACPASKAVQDKTPDPVKCLSLTCGRTFPKQVGMLRHYKMIHAGPPRPGPGQLTGAHSGVVRKGLSFGSLTNFDTKLPEMNVIGQIIPSASYVFQPGLCANIHRQSLPVSVGQVELNDTERDNGSLRSSSMTIKQEVESSGYADSKK